MILRGDPLRKQLPATSCKESRLCVPVAWSAINNAQTMRERLSYVRGFARYRQASDPRTQIPAPGLLPGRPKRARPYLYFAQEIEALLDAARHMPHRYQSGVLLPWVCYCLFGLLSVTGLRLSSCVKPWAALNSAGRIDHDDCHQLSTPVGVVLYPTFDAAAPSQPAYHQFPPRHVPAISDLRSTALASAVLTPDHRADRRFVRDNLRKKNRSPKP